MTANKSEITISVIISNYNHPEWLEKFLWGYEVQRYKNYGQQDRSLGERLVNLGVKPIQLRDNAIAIHLDHKHSYKAQESIDKNRAIRKATKTNKSTFIPYGVGKYNEG